MTRFSTPSSRAVAAAEFARGGASALSGQPRGRTPFTSQPTSTFQAGKATVPVNALTAPTNALARPGMVNLLTGTASPSTPPTGVAPAPARPIAAVAPPGKQRVAAYQTALQGMNLSPAQLDQEAERGEAMRQAIAPLARKQSPKMGDVMDAISSAVKAGTISPKDASAALATMPGEDKLPGWLADRHHAIVGMLVHVHGARAAQR